MQADVWMCECSMVSTNVISLKNGTLNRLNSPVPHYMNRIMQPLWNSHIIKLGVVLYIFFFHNWRFLLNWRLMIWTNVLPQDFNKELPYVKAAIVYTVFSRFEVALLLGRMVVADSIKSAITLCASRVLKEWVQDEANLTGVETFLIDFKCRLRNHLFQLGWWELRESW